MMNYFSRRKFNGLLIFVSFAMVLTPIVIVFWQSWHSTENVAVAFRFILPVISVVFMVRLVHFAKSAYTISAEAERFKFTGLFDRERYVDYSDILEIRTSRINQFDCVVVWRQGRIHRWLLINAEMTEFGRLLELFLMKANNLKKLRIEPLPKLMFHGRPVWQKEPDWDIIIAAMKRAEENRST